MCYMLFLYYVKINFESTYYCPRIEFGIGFDLR